MNFVIPIWKKKMLVSSLSAQKEMDKEGIDLYDIVKLLKNSRGFKTKRKKGIHEFISTRRKRSYKIVLAESFQKWSKEEVFLILHVKSIGVKK